MHQSAAADSGARLPDVGCSSSSRPESCRQGRRLQVMREGVSHAAALWFLKVFARASIAVRERRLLREIRGVGAEPPDHHATVVRRVVSSGLMDRAESAGDLVPGRAAHFFPVRRSNLRRRQRPARTADLRLRGFERGASVVGTPLGCAPRGGKWIRSAC